MSRTFFPTVKVIDGGGVCETDGFSVTIRSNFDESMHPGKAVRLVTGVRLAMSDEHCAVLVAHKDIASRGILIRESPMLIHPAGDSEIAFTLWNSNRNERESIASGDGVASILFFIPDKPTVEFVETFEEEGVGFTTRPCPRL